MDLVETVPSVFSETCLTVSADGSEVSDIRAEEVLHTQEEEVLHTQEEEDCLEIALPASEKVCCVCNILVLTVVQAFKLASNF
jgi:hypothetical protein